MTITEPAARTGLRLRPYLVVDGADAAIAFYREVFGARVVGDLIRGDDGRIGHSELEIDGGSFFLADAYPEYGIDAPDPAVGVAAPPRGRGRRRHRRPSVGARRHGAAAGGRSLLRLSLGHPARPVRPPVADRRARHGQHHPGGSRPGDGRRGLPLRDRRPRRTGLRPNHPPARSWRPRGRTRPASATSRSTHPTPTERRRSSGRSSAGRRARAARGSTSRTSRPRVASTARPPSRASRCSSG